MTSLVAALVGVALASPIAAQLPTVLHGRVEDAATRQPVAEATVFAADSSSVAYTDSTGGFVIEVDEDLPLALHVERLGYLSQRFELDATAPQRLSVLLLEPAPLELEGVTVIEEQAITVLVQNLKNRRNAYPHSMSAFDRSWIDRFMPVGSAYDVVRRRLPHIGPCRSDRDQLCVPGRIRTVSNPYPQARYTVCVDGWPSIQPMIELNTLDLSSVALVEVFNGTPRQIRVYTQQWMIHRARTGHTWVLPLIMGC